MSSESLLDTGSQQTTLFIWTILWLFTVHQYNSLVWGDHIWLKLSPKLCTISGHCQNAEWYSGWWPSPVRVARISALNGHSNNHDNIVTCDSVWKLESFAGEKKNVVIPTKTCLEYTIKTQNKLIVCSPIQWKLTLSSLSLANSHSLRRIMTFDSTSKHQLPHWRHQKTRIYNPKTARNAPKTPLTAHHTAPQIVFTDPLSNIIIAAPIA